ncbi:hypothetical protein INT43_006179 [Umbelopsis isabellina]|uniref:Choice-of-anchor A domain-containing protein n=1 Tax=Mortierella isabellina TaxID=91625 RepID=A0A8H7Q178_MORIS|nr:hypothetical protein INT43_006179 [Umbelopsis isabellina]
MLAETRRLDLIASRRMVEETNMEIQRTLEEVASTHTILAATTPSPPGSNEDTLDKPRLFNFVKESCQCNDTAEGSWTKLLRFNAIVFQDFTTYGSQDILGRLAVGGNLNTPNYLVNANSGQQCYGTNTVPWDELALAVGGRILTPDVKVHGHWWTAGSGSAVELNAECNSPATLDTPFPFADVQQNLNLYSQKYAAVQPNLMINDDNSVTPLNTQSSACENAITLWPCYSHDLTTCIRNEDWSGPGRILYGQPNWNGPTNGYPNLDRLLIVNVPVFNGTTLDITTNQPSMGAASCSLLWNFYPVDNNGNYLDTGSFQLIRSTGSPFKGVILAPRADIIDGSSGVFEGSIVANSYRWQRQNGVEIHNTPACNGYHFCLPDGGGGGLPQGSAASSGTISTFTDVVVQSRSTRSVAVTVSEPSGTTRPTDPFASTLSVIETPGPDPTSPGERPNCGHHHHHHHHHKAEHDSHNYESHKHGDHGDHEDHDNYDSHDDHKHSDYHDENDSHDSHDSHNHGDNDDWHKDNDGELWQDDECADDDYYHDDYDHDGQNYKHKD